MNAHRVVHLSDLHFGSEIPAVVAALSAELNRDPPALVAISGDLTRGARNSEFRAARAFIDGIRAPVLAVPGNHDITPYGLLERFLDPYGRWRAHIGKQTEPVFQDGRIGVVGLNTARRAGLHFDWSRGRVGQRRLARCVARLAALPPGLARIVVAHHPFMPPRAMPSARVVDGARTALTAFARHGVRLVLSGHLHVGDVAHPMQDATAPGTGEAPPAGTLSVVLAATATSHRLRGEPNAFNEIRVHPDGHIEVFARAWNGARWAPLPAEALHAAAAPLTAMVD
jgi:3',5'-cyclic AMP phosphodiesterase CpdA